MLKRLQNIFRSREQAKAQEVAWERDITYRAEVGVMFKDVLSISPKVLPGKINVSPEAITRVRWGRFVHSERRSHRYLHTGIW